MPTIVTHALLPLAAAAAFPHRFPSRLFGAAMAAAVIPDLDVIGFRFGIAYADAWGHRGATHSIMFALALGALGALAAQLLRASARLCFVAIAAATLSHPLADMLTNGGLGVALLWPVDSSRLFFPVRPIEVSAIGLSRFLSSDALAVLRSETVWLLLPVFLIALLVRIGRLRGGFARPQ